jgi:hypothetical protein
MLPAVDVMGLPGCFMHLGCDKKVAVLVFDFKRMTKEECIVIFCERVLPFCLYLPTTSSPPHRVVGGVKKVKQSS